MALWRKILNIDLQTYNEVDGSQFKGFLLDQLKSESPAFLFDGAQELKVDDEKLVAEPARSTSLLVYAALNQGVVFIGENYESTLEAGRARSKFVPDPNFFFRGTNIELPKNNALSSKYRSFEEWTAVNEVKHVSLWLLAALRGIYGPKLQSALEVHIPLPGEKRPGRLDVVARLKEHILCLEAKTSIVDAVRDLRFVEQVPKYTDEILKTVATTELGSDEATPLIFLVTGGTEYDLGCHDGHLRLSPVGERFIEMCIRNKVRFLTANSVWQLLAKKLTQPDSGLDTTHLLHYLATAPDVVGLSSAGFVTYDHSIEKRILP